MYLCCDCCLQEIAVEVLSEALKEKPHAHFYLVEGFPRNLDQLEDFNEQVCLYFSQVLLLCLVLLVWVLLFSLHTENQIMTFPFGLLLQEWRSGFIVLLDCEESSSLLWSLSAPSSSSCSCFCVFSSRKIGDQGFTMLILSYLIYPVVWLTVEAPL